MRCYVRRGGGDSGFHPTSSFLHLHQTAWCPHCQGLASGLQFDELFKDELYLHIGEKSNAYAREINAALKDAGLPLFGDYPTNQVFFVISHEKMEQLKKQAQYAYMERYDENSSVIRFCTSWSTREEDVKKCCEIIRGM